MRKVTGQIDYGGPAGQPQGNPYDMADEGDGGMPPRARRYAMAAIIMVIGLTILGNDLVNVAMPVVTRDFSVTASIAVWVLNGYQLALLAALLPCASLAEKFGYRRVFVAGQVGFVAASLLCTLAPSFEFLIVGRILQGLSAAAALSLISATVRLIHPKESVGRGIGATAIATSIFSTFGPSLGALVLNLGGWPALFAFNIPVGLAALAMSIRFLPDSRKSRHRFDWISALLCASACILFVTGMESLGRAPFAGLAGLGLSAGAFILLYRREKDASRPLLPLDLLRHPPIRLAVIASGAFFAAQACCLVTLPFYMQNDLGRSVVETGVLMTLWPLTTAISSYVVSRTVRRGNTRLSCIVGTLLLTSALALMGLSPFGANLLLLALMLGVAGVGSGLFLVPNNWTMLMSAPMHRSAGSGGLQATVRQLGRTVGTTFVGLAFGAIFYSGTTIAFVAGALFALAACFASVMRPKER